MNYNFLKLREDLKEECQGAMFNGFPIAIVDLTEIEYATDLELIDIAKRMKFDLSRYEKVKVYNK